MTKSAKYHDRNDALYPKNGGGRNFKDVLYDRGTETRGLVETKHGIVIAYSHKNDNGFQSSSLEIIKNGRSYSRYFDKYFTSRGLVTKAKQFANEVFEDK